MQQITQVRGELLSAPRRSAVWIRSNVDRPPRCNQQTRGAKWHYQSVSAFIRALHQGLTNHVIDYHLARYFFPLVAVYLQSGNVEPEDILELPMPHPKAWYQTFRYACTEQGELTDAMRENIKHLGGKV